MSHDVIVVGAGSAGAALASRVSEDPERSVLLIEAGPDYPEFESLPDELKYCYATGILNATSVERDEGWEFSARHDWRYQGRGTALAPSMPVARGRTSGGSSAINGTIWQRATVECYDAWAAATESSAWSYEELLPIMHQIENDPAGGPSHSTEGPIRIRRYPREEWRVPHAAFYEAARAAGYPHCEDTNVAGSTGVGPMAFNNPDDIRWSTALGYLPSARERSNFSIEPETSVRRVVFDGMRAVGVEVQTADGISVREADTIVLSAGSIGSAQLLMLSGVGPGDQLRDHGIPIVRVAPGVGANLQDHPMAQMCWSLRPEYAAGPRDPRVQMILRYTSSGSPEPNDVWIAAVTVEDTFIMFPGLHAPHSRGSLRLASANPADAPLLDYNYYSDARDLSRMRDTARLALELSKHKGLADLVSDRLMPLDSEIQSDDDFDDWLRARTITTNHISGTCKMGPSSDPMAVVDATGHVHGIEGLVVADASIMPTISRAPTNLSTITIGENVAAMLRASQPHATGGRAL